MLIISTAGVIGKKHLWTGHIPLCTCQTSEGSVDREKNNFVALSCMQTVLGHEKNMINWIRRVAPIVKDWSEGQVFGLQQELEVKLRLKGIGLRLTPLQYHIE